MKSSTANLLLLAGAVLPVVTTKFGSRNHPLDETVREFERQLEAEYGLTPRLNRPWVDRGHVNLWITSGGFLKLQSIRIPESKRGQGIGTAIMKRITDFADQHGLTTALTPAPPKNTVRAKSRLIRWYKSLGFVPNKGRNKDFGTRETMLRRPLGSRNHPLDETVEAFERQLEAEYGLSSAKPLGPAIDQRDQNPKGHINLYITDTGFLTLQSIRIPESERARGSGTAIMQRIARFADAHGLTTVLTPAPLGGDSPYSQIAVRHKNRLTRWYKSLGFVPSKGRTMLRRPNLGNIRDKLSQIVVRPIDWQATSPQAYNYFDQLAAELPNSAWRGMTSAEYIATVGAGKGVKSRGDYSFDTEGTQFSAHPGDTESYINFGRDDPRKTEIPTYMVEVDRSVLRLKPDGYWETAPGTAVPMQSILSVHRFIPRDGHIVAERIR